MITLTAGELVKTLRLLGDVHTNEARMLRQNLTKQAQQVDPVTYHRLVSKDQITPWEKIDV